jgi:hypothetical protein
MVVERDPRGGGVRLIAHEGPVVGVDEAVGRAEHDRRSHDRLGHAGVADVHGERGAIRDPVGGRDHELMAVAGEGGLPVVHLDPLDRELLEVEIEAREILRRPRRDLVKRVQPIGGRVIRQAQVVMLDVITPVALKREVWIADTGRAGRVAALLGADRRVAGRISSSFHMGGGGRPELTTGT